MLVAALFRQNGVPQNVLALPVHRPAFEIAQPHARRGEHRHVAIGQENHILGVREDGRHVRRHEVFVVAGAHHQGRLVARRHDLVRVRTRNHRQRERSGQFVDGLAHGLFQVAVQMAFHQVRHHFGVRLGGKGMPLCLQAVLELQVILDDAVVHHHHVAMAIAMRMRVLFGGTAVGGPAGVADAERAVHRVEPDGIFQVAQFALGAPNGELPVVAEHGDAGRVVTAILQPLQTFQDNRNGSMIAHITDDSAHALYYGLFEDLDAVLFDYGVG